MLFIGCLRWHYTYAESPQPQPPIPQSLHLVSDDTINIQSHTICELVL